MNPKDDWPVLMAFGIGALRLPASAFWAMSWPELAAAATTVNGQMALAKDAINRDWLNEAMSAFPDSPISKNEGL